MTASLTAALNDPAAFFSLIKKEATAAELSGRFIPTRMPYLHVCSITGGTVTLRFVNTLKTILDKSFKPMHDRSSHLSYLEISVQPAGKKAYFKVFYTKQIQIQHPFNEATAKHEEQLTRLREIAASYGIDLSDPRAWDSTYREGYKNGGR